MSNELMHYGVRGQKWGDRRYQNADGSLTKAGERRYGSIENYKKGTTGLRQILKSSDLEFVSIEGEELPKTFIKDAEKKGVHVIHNKQTIIRGKNPILNSTLRIQLQLQMEKQLELIQRERLVLGRDMLNELLNRAIKEKGEEL